MDVILCKCDGSIVKVSVNDFNDYCKYLGGFEVVRTDRLRECFPEPVVMVVDDNFFAHDKEYNFIASCFYAGDILGDVVFVPERDCDFADFWDIDECIDFLNTLRDEVLPG